MHGVNLPHRYADEVRHRPPISDATIRSCLHRVQRHRTEDGTRRVATSPRRKLQVSRIAKSRLHSELLQNGCQGHETASEVGCMTAVIWAPSPKHRIGRPRHTP